MCNFICGVIAKVGRFMNIDICFKSAEFSYMYFIEAFLFLIRPSPLSVLVLVNSRNRRPFWTSQGYAGSWLARFNEQACPLGKRSFLARLLWICNPNLFCKHFSSLNLTDDLFRSFSNILSYINNTLKSIFRQFLMSMSFMTNYYNNCPYICSRMF